MIAQLNVKQSSHLSALPRAGCGLDLTQKCSKSKFDSNGQATSIPITHRQHAKLPMGSHHFDYARNMCTRPYAVRQVMFSLQNQRQRSASRVCHAWSCLLTHCDLRPGKQRAPYTNRSRRCDWATTRVFAGLCTATSSARMQQRQQVNLEITTQPHRAHASTADKRISK